MQNLEIWKPRKKNWCTQVTYVYASYPFKVDKTEFLHLSLLQSWMYRCYSAKLSKTFNDDGSLFLFSSTREVTWRFTILIFCLKISVPVSEIPVEASTANFPLKPRKQRFIKPYVSLNFPFFFCCCNFWGFRNLWHRTVLRKGKIVVPAKNRTRGRGFYREH